MASDAHGQGANDANGQGLSAAQRRAIRLVGEKVCVDAGVLVGWVADDPEVAHLVAPLFELADQGQVRLMASTMSLMEVLVVPYKMRRWQLAEQCASALVDSPGIELIDAGPAVLQAAARLHAISEAHARDAIHLATALTCGCGFFLTTNREVPEVPGLQVIQVAE